MALAPAGAFLWARFDHFQHFRICKSDQTRAQAPGTPYRKPNAWYSSILRLQMSKKKVLRNHS